MKSIFLCAAAAAALTTVAGAADAQPRPRFPIHRAPASTQPAPQPASAPATPAEAPAEAPPAAAPAGEVTGTALPALQPVETAPPAAAEAAPAPAPAPAEPVLRLAAAVSTAAPTESATVSAPVYTMQSGDTLMGVTRRFKTTLAKLRELNGLPADASIKAGQKIRLPAEAADTGAELFAKGPAPTLTTVRRAEAPARPAVARNTPPPPAALPRATASTAAAPVLEKPTPPPAATPRPTAVAAAPAPQPAATASPPPASAAPVVTAAATTAAPTPLPPVVRTNPPPAPAATASSAPMVAAAAAATVPTDPVSVGRGRFVWPVRGEVITPFGPKGPGQRNDGLNIAAREGDPVQAAAAGEVVYAGDQVPGFGKLVLIKHEGGWVTAYAHLSEITVKMKDRVNQAGEIGKAGRTGAVASPQLHFEVRYAPTAKDKARPVDPMPLLPQ